MRTNFSGGMSLTLQLRHQIRNLGLQRDDVVNVRKIHIDAGSRAARCRQFTLYMPQLEAQSLQLCVSTCSTAFTALTLSFRSNT